MIKPLAPETLTWLRQTAKFEGGVTAQALLHLLERMDALEAAQQQPTPEAVPVAWGNFRDDGTCVGLTERFEDTTRWLNPRPLFLSFRLPVAQPAQPAQPAPVAAPAGGLVEEVARIIAIEDEADQ
jgi:hypothetical protein